MFKAAIAAGAFVLDVRTAGEYAEGHVEGAVNIPLRSLAQNLDMIPTDRQVVIYCKSGLRVGYATASLGMLGYDNIMAFPPSWNAWVAAGEPVSMDPPATEKFDVPDIAPEMLEAVDGFLSTIPEGWLTAGDVDAVKAAMDVGSVMLDVRTSGEYAEGFIPGAISVTLREIPDLMDTIPTDKPLISYCKSGWRTAMSIPVLHVLGLDTTKVFTGSWLAWTDAGEEIEMP